MGEGIMTEKEGKKADCWWPAWDKEFKPTVGYWVPSRAR